MRKTYRTNDKFLEYKEDYEMENRIFDWLRNNTFTGELVIAGGTKGDLNANTPYGLQWLYKDDFEEFNVPVLPEDLFTI